MKLQVLDTKVNLFLEIQKENIINKEDGSCRLIIRMSEKEYDYPKVIVLDFEEKYSRLLLEINDKKIKNKIFFIEGKYRALKNKNEVAFINVKVDKVQLFDKNKTLDINKLKTKVRLDFKNLDIKELKEKYRGDCTEEVIYDLKELIEKKEIHNQEINLAKYELEKLRLERRLEKQRKSENKIKWYEHIDLSLIHISEPTRQCEQSRMPSSA